MPEEVRVLRLQEDVREELALLQDAVVAVHAALVPAAAVAGGFLVLLLHRRLLRHLHLHVLRPLDHRMPHRVAAAGRALPLAGGAVDDRLDVPVVDRGGLGAALHRRLLDLDWRRLHADARHRVGYAARAGALRRHRGTLLDQAGVHRIHLNLFRYDVTLVVRDRIDLDVPLVWFGRRRLLLPLLLKIVHIVPLYEALLLFEAVADLRAGARYAALDARVLLRVRFRLRAAALLVRRVGVGQSHLLPVHVTVVVEALLLDLVVVVDVMAVGLDVLPQGRRVGVPLWAARHFAAIGLVYGVGSGVLEPVRGVRVSFVAALDRADVGTLAGVRARVDLQILRSAEALVALEAVMRLLVRVRTYVDQHLVPAAVTKAYVRDTKVIFYRRVHTARAEGELTSR